MKLQEIIHIHTNPEIFEESLFGPGSGVKLFCEEHQKKAPLSSLVTV